MKKMTFIAIPVIVVIALLAGAAVWKIMMPAAAPVTVQQGPLPSGETSTGGSQPANPFSALFGQSAPQTTVMPTPTPASAAAMNADVNTVGDDGGASDFSSLQSQASGL